MLPALIAAVASTVITSTPNDPLFLGNADGSQWNLMGTVDPDHPDAGIRGIDAEGAWQITAGRPDVLIAVLDSGVLLTHEDLAANIAINYGEAIGAGLIDLDGDGILTLAEAATIVTDLDQDGAITPNDVRIFCENGIDDDGNGYVDDTVGWDFEENDDDPTDHYGHGTGRAGIAAAVANNGVGMVGVCPYCRILPVRMGPTFVAVPDKLAEAIAYAADRGAASTVMATGALGNSAEVRDAVAYADSRGVVQCAAIGNEASRHHHFPQTYEDVISTTGIKPDAMSYDARWTGSNFGAHAIVAAPTFVFATQLDGTYRIEGGTSSSVPHCAGVAALVVSRARDLGITLTPRQVRSILASTAEDAPAFSAERGAGRLDARAAVEAVGPAVPPDARIVEPRWYHTFGGGAVPVALDVRGSPTVELEMGYGVEPSSWVPVSGASVSPLPPDPVAPLDDRLGDDFAVTLRLTATSTNGSVTVDRRTFFVHPDPDLRAGFPLDLGSSAEGAPLLVDLDGDNRLEIVVATSDGVVRAYTANGLPLPGWPVSLDPSPVAHASAAAHASAVPTCCATIFAGLAAGDLDGDHVPEIIATSLDGKVYAWRANGTRLAGFPKDLGSPLWASPVLADLDGNGTLSIIAATYSRSVHVLDGAANERSGFPVSATDASANGPRPGLVASPAVGDLDGDGLPEIVVATTESDSEMLHALGRVYAFHADGSPVSGFPVKPWGAMPETFPVVGSGVPAAPILVDLDGDGKVEIVAGHAAGQLVAFSADGSLARGFDHGSFVDGISPYGPDKKTADPAWELNLFLLAQPVAADLANSGRADLISGTMGLHTVDVSALIADPGEALTSLSSLLTVWRPDGTVRHPFPQLLEGWTLFTGVTIADVDADTLPEILAGTDGGWLHAWNARGEEAAGFPKFTGGWLSTSAATGDLDADGKIDVVTATREGQLFAWTTPGAACVNRASAARWPFLHHDLRNSGDGRLDAIAPAAVADAHVEDGAIVFTAVGDDGFAGAAKSYDVRWSANPIDGLAAFEAATTVAGPQSAPAGRTLRAGSGIPASAHVAVLAHDAAGNVSELASASAAQAPADACVDAAVIHLDAASRGCRCGIESTDGPPAPSLALLALVALVVRRMRTRTARLRE